MLEELDSFWRIGRRPLAAECLRFLFLSDQQRAQLTLPRGSEMCIQASDRLRRAIGRLSFSLHYLFMEAVGFVASIIALVEAANTLFEYVKDVKEGSSNHGELQLSLATLPASLRAQFENTAPGNSWSTETCKLAAKDGPFDQLSAVFKRIETKLQTPAT
ncbi:hypothetical protein C8J56DRAFT_1069042 [Mycena floridula]|nr:hypothetical protein C8J56DRAFT_1069042 [Mycena floridula]